MNPVQRILAAIRERREKRAREKMAAWFRRLPLAKQAELRARFKSGTAVSALPCRTCGATTGCPCPKVASDYADVLPLGDGTAGAS